MEALHNMRLPPGFGFHPSDAELLSHYLKKKVHGQKIDYDLIPEVDIYKHEPWDLPSKCNLPIEDNKWHFFAARDRKYPTGARSNRATKAGYWKSTGKDRAIKMNKRTLGTKKTLVFHEGRPPSGKRTEWIMHEYYIDESECQASPDMKDAFVLCRVTRRDDWALENDNGVVNRSPRPQQLNGASTSVFIAEKTEDVAVSDICSGEHNHVPTPASAEQSNDFAAADVIVQSPNTDSEMNAFLDELLAGLSSYPEMDTGCADLSLTEQNDVSSKLQNPGSIAPKIEPDPSPIQNGMDEIDGLTLEELQSIIPGIDGCSNPFADFMMGMDHGTTQNNIQETNEELQFHEEYSANMPNENSDNGITVRSRKVTVSSASTSPLNRRIKLQVGLNRMVTSNSETINETIKVEDNSGRMRSFRQSDANKSSENFCSENQGHPKRINNAVRSSVGFNILFACICLIGAIAAVLHGYYRSGISL